MITKSLPKEDWAYIQHALTTRARRKESSLKNYKSKGAPSLVLQMLAQDVARCTKLAREVAP